MITGMPRIAIAVRDLDAAGRTFGEAFGMPVNDISATSVPSLGVRIAMCAPGHGSNIELMAPADPSKPLNASLQRFLDRRGEGLFALMLEAPDPNAEAEVLAARGLEVMPLMPGAGGRDVHPRSTHGVLVRVYPSRPAAGSAAHEVPVTGIARVIVAASDFEDAVAVYRDGFVMAFEAPEEDAERGVRAARLRPGTGGVIEVVAPRDSSRPFAAAVARALARHEGMYALVLQAPDPAAFAAALRAHGLRAGPAADAPDVVEVEPASAHGALIRIERRP